MKIRNDHTIRILLLLITVGIIVLMFPRGESIESDVSVNSIWIKNDLIASVTFEILKDPIVIENEKETAANKIYQVFNKNTDIPKLVEDTLHSYNERLTAILQQIKYSPGAQQDFSNFPLSKESLESLKYVRIKGSKSVLSLNKIFDYYDAELKKIYRRGVLSLSYNQIEKDTISMRDGKFERNYLKVNFHDFSTLSSYLDHSLRKTFGSNSSINSAVKEYLTNFIKPNIIFSKQETDNSIAEAIDKVPTNLGIVNENERIVAKHDRITSEIKA
ncbi:MAG: hydrolase, partial [Bacteroidota bacterium]